MEKKEIVSLILNGDIDKAISIFQKEKIQHRAGHILEECIKEGTKNKISSDKLNNVLGFVDTFVTQEDLLSYEAKNGTRSVLIDFAYKLGRSEINTSLWEKSSEMMKLFVCELVSREKGQKGSMPTGNSLFFFCAPEDYVFSQLAVNEISVSSPDTFNDPFDCLVLSSIRNEERNLKELTKRYEVKTFVEELRKIRVQCFAGIDTSKTKFPPYLNSLMWGHYAKRHHGFCIQYELEDGSPLLNDGDIGVGKRCRMDKVIYRDDLVSSDGALLSYEKCFLVKKEAWSYENEYRIVYYDANRDEQYYNVSLDSIGLKIICVYFGLNCSNGNRAIVQQLLKNKDVGFYEIVRDENYLNKLEIKAF